MMDYEIFKNLVKEKILSYMPEKYQEMEVAVNTVEKINRKMDGMSLKSVDSEQIISPTIYINDMYESYLNSGSLQEVLQDTAIALDKAFTQTFQLPSLDTNTARDNVVFQLVNTMQNEDMLQNVPHRDFQDLSIIYRLVVSVDNDKVLSSMINDNLAKKLGMNEKQLFNAAAENTRRIFPPVIKSMNEVLKEAFISDNISPEQLGFLDIKLPPEQTIWVVTNELGMNGAASMLYEDKLHDLSKNVGSDLYLLPSSVHEVIAVSVDMGSPEDLAQMVAEINMDSVSLGERLSNQVYHYNKNLREITLATDTPNKRLDGVVAEQVHDYESKKSR